MTNTTTLPKLTLIKAGAGSGKTFGIQEQLTKWVIAEKIKPEKILAVTFTNGGAAELRERIRANLLAEISKKAKASENEGKEDSSTKIDLAAIDKAQITTIHGFGLSLVERFAYAKGISPKPRQLNEAEQAQLIKHATAQLEQTLETITKNLDLYGYTGTMQGDKFVSKTDQLRGDVFKIIERLRGLGKGAQSDDENVAEAKRLIEATQEKIENLYGETSDQSEEELNQALYKAVQTLKEHFKDAEELNSVVGTKAFNTFSSAVFAATEEKINTDWKFWTRLQEDKELSKKAYKQIDDHSTASHFYSVWRAAAKLTQHPGPLKQAKEHAAILLQATFDALATYQQGKANAGLLDFTDMVQLAQQIVNDKDCFKELEKEVECLVIDEFQDTNPLQFSLLKPFMDAGIPTYIVGDLKQSIMGFQGADSRLFENLTKQNPTTEKEENWRSSTKVMAFVNKMGKELYPEPNEYISLQPKAETDKEKPPYKEKSHFDIAVRRIIFDGATWGLDNRTTKKPVFKSAGYAYLAKEMHKLVEDKQQVIDKHSGKARDIKYSDIAVLASKHTNLYDFSERLRAVNIPVRLAEDGWYKSESVQYALNALQYLNNTYDHYAALSLITNPLENANLQEALDDFYASKKFNHEQLSSIEKLKNNKGEDLHYLHEGPVKEQLLSLIDELNVFEKLQTLNEGGQLRANLVKLLSLAEEFEQTAETSLQAAGVYGKNAHAFSAWIKAQSEDNRQPANENPSQDAVVLKTWHGSKGLEWPVVVVLDAHEDREPRLPHIGVSYAPDVSADEMLKKGSIDFLPSMADKTKKEEFEASLQQEADAEQKNLIYVALTRAREQIILPWFKAEEKKAEEQTKKPNSLISYLDKLLSDDIVDEYWKDKATKVNRDEVACADKGNELKAAIEGNAEEALIKQASTQKQLQLDNQPLSAALAATVSPSEQPAPNESEQVSIASTQQHQYGEALDFKELEGQGLRANEIGTWMHRLYHVYLKQPENTELLETAMQLFPKEDITLTDDFKQKVIGSLTAFKHWLDNELQAQAYYCELPILAINEQGQTISGTIDLLVETEQGYWILDHKTNQQSDFAKHQQQLMAYAKALGEQDGKTVQGVAVNWVRESYIESVEG